MQFKQLQNQFRRSISEDKLVLYNQNLHSYHGSKENIKNANCMFPKITSSRSETINLKQQNRIRMKAESFMEEKLKEAINLKKRDIQQLNFKEKQYVNEYEQLKKQLKVAKETNNYRREENCRADIHDLVKLIELRGNYRSELRAELYRLQKQLKQFKDKQI